MPAAFHPTFLTHHGVNHFRAVPADIGSFYGYAPAQVRTAYGIDRISFGGTAGTGSGQIIAIVDAYNDPNILNDVDAFDREFGLTTSGPSLYQQFGAAATFLTVYDQNGHVINPTNTSVPVDPDETGMGADWEAEEALDVEWAHAIAPGAKIALVECNSNNDDLYTGVQAAANLPGVSVVSMSWSDDDHQGENNYDHFFTTPAGHQGVTFLASTGDYSVSGYPAYSPNVIAVGGTTLTLDEFNHIESETAWSTFFDGSGTGGGTSRFEPEPAYQQRVQHTGFRTNPDVSLLADPYTGAAVYDSYQNFGWMQIGGTSLACPAWAGILAVANQGRALQGKATLNNSSNPQETLTALYGLPGSDFHDITDGEITAPDGENFPAGPGYDEVTGLGTPVANALVADLVAYGSPSNPSASQLGFTTQPPANIAGGSPFSTVVQLENASGGAVALAGVSITLTLSSGTFSNGTATVFAASDSAGRAAFSNLVISTAGTYTLTASAPGLASARSTALTVGSSDPNDWFSQHVSDPALQALARTDYNRDHAITYSDMLGLFATAESEGTVTSNVLQSLQALANNASALNMPAYVSNLAGKVVNGDPDNATFRSLNSLGYVVSASLGNLRVGSSATLLTSLVSKWFLGVNPPAAAVSYSVAGGSLFGPNGPVYTDVTQGNVGDCWLLSSLAEAAARRSSLITNMFIYDGTNVVNGHTVGVYTVRLFTNGVANYVTVDTELPAGGSYYDRTARGVLWVALAEKAYAQANGEGAVQTNTPNTASYEALDFGWPSWALKAITGESATDYDLNTTAAANALQAGELVVISTSNPSSPYVVPNHAYALVDYNPSSSMPFLVYNPWGTDSTGWSLSNYNGRAVYGLFHADAGFIYYNFSVDSLAATGLDTASGSSSLEVVLTGNTSGEKVLDTVAAAPVPLSMPQTVGARQDQERLMSHVVDRRQDAGTSAVDAAQPEEGFADSLPITDRRKVK
jgi:hypothetical protein